MQTKEITNLIILVLHKHVCLISNKEEPSWTKYRSKLALLDMARPTGQVKQ